MSEVDAVRIATDLMRRENLLDSCRFGSARYLPPGPEPYQPDDAEWIIMFMWETDGTYVESPGHHLVIVDDATGAAHLADIL